MSELDCGYECIIKPLVAFVLGFLLASMLSTGVGCEVKIIQKPSVEVPER